jgi:hypothetical protein
MCDDSVKESVKVKFEYSRPLRDGGTVYMYRVGSWSMEVVYDENGVLDLDSDADLQHARQGAEAWKAWADFLEAGGLEKNDNDTDTDTV